MGYLGRRIGKAQDQGDSNPGGADGAVGGGILDLFANGYFERQGDIYNAPGVVPPPQGMTASGGVISDYSSGNTIYRAHVFTSSGTFGVTDLGEIVENGLADYLVVAGGGSGAPQTSGGLYSGSGGGGAGGLRTSLPGIMPATSSQIPFSVGNHAIVIGGGGASPFSASGNGRPGTDSSLAYNGGTITSNAGGGGGETQQSGLAGGSGGGAGGNNHNSNRTGGAANPNSNPTRQGYPGTTLATNDNDGGGGGGGGAGGTTPYGSSPSDHKRRGIVGGAGVQVAIAGPTATTFTAVGAKNPANNQYQYFAGGGGGGGYDGTSTGLGGVGGGGRGEVPPGSSIPEERHGQTGTGGGGGGARGKGPSGGAGSGGSGIVIVRYQIGTVSTAKASGGAISFFGGKTIHSFVSAGDFNNTSGGNLSCDVVMIAGGGGGGHNEGGGGGAGGYIFQPGRTVGTGPHGIIIGAGGRIQTGSGGDGVPGSDTTFDGLTAKGGGAGGNWPAGAGDPGGSGGGGASNSGSAGPTSQPGQSGDSGTYGSGFAGGAGGGNGSQPPYAGGGGGGAGGEGGAAASDANGHGGIGKQIPAVFHDPASGVGAPGPTATNVAGGTPGKFWIGGGGGGGSTSQPPGKGGGSGGPYAGGGDGTSSSPQPEPLKRASHGEQNTGGGGGSHGAGTNNNVSPTIGRGGSGIVLIAYPT